MTRQSDTFRTKKRAPYHAWALDEDIPAKEVGIDAQPFYHPRHQGGRLRYTHIGDGCGGLMFRNTKKRERARWMECVKCGKQFKLVRDPSPIKKGN